MLSAEGFSTNEVDFSSLEFPKYAYIFNLSRLIDMYHLALCKDSYTGVDFYELHDNTWVDV